MQTTTNNKQPEEETHLLSLLPCSLRLVLHGRLHLGRLLRLRRRDRLGVRLRPAAEHTCVSWNRKQGTV
jgi:hypothetical protein